MVYNKDIIAFFGPGYSHGSNAITLKTNDGSTTTGGTFSATAVAGTITTASAHNLLVGDRVRLTEVTTLPTGLAAATDYWVIAVPSTTQLQLSASKSGPAVTITVDGTSDNTLQAFGPLVEVTDVEADETTGDSKKVLFGIVEALYQRWNNTPEADRSSKVTFTKSKSLNSQTGEETVFFNLSFKVNPIAVEVVEE